MRPLRNHLSPPGMPVEGTKGEAEAGQEELNIRYARRARLRRSPHHRQARGQGDRLAAGARRELPAEVARGPGRQRPPCPPVALEGRRARLLRRGRRAWACRELMQHYMAGLLQIRARIHLFPRALRQQLQALPQGHLRADASTVWSVDNRTAGFRLVRRGHARACASNAASAGRTSTPISPWRRSWPPGSQGIEEGLSCRPPITRRCLRGATRPARSRTPCATRRETLRGSAMLRAALGDEVVDHYARAAEWEQEEFDSRRDRLGNRARLRTLPEDLHDDDPDMHLADRRIGLRRAPGAVAPTPPRAAVARARAAQARLGRAAAGGADRAGRGRRRRGSAR